MEIPIYQIDAFTDRVFGGNPAAVCLLESWLPDATLQSIAAENNVSETAFLVVAGASWEIRWFTPTTEVDLCGHATLASAYVLLTHVRPEADAVELTTRRSGAVAVRRDGSRLVLDFPARESAPVEAPSLLSAALGAAPLAVERSERDFVALFASEADVRALAPDFARLATLEALGVIATAPGTDVDFVSRFFAPRVGVDEDPVTGSAHCTLIPYWAARTGRTALTARQVSRRGGELGCELRGDRVRIAGYAVQYLAGRITL